MRRPAAPPVRLAARPEAVVHLDRQAAAVHLDRQAAAVHLDRQAVVVRLARQAALARLARPEVVATGLAGRRRSAVAGRARTACRRSRVCLAAHRRPSTMVSAVLRRQ
jgi:hypothetical protein